jgi:hypothetical protein
MVWMNLDFETVFVQTFQKPRFPYSTTNGRTGPSEEENLVTHVANVPTSPVAHPLRADRSCKNDSIVESFIHQR